MNEVSVHFSHPELATGDIERQAVASLKGYAYQLVLSAIAWTELGDGEYLQLEVAEDYAKLARSSLLGVQVKHENSSLTLNSGSVSDTINALFLLRKKNPERKVRIAYLTTSTIGRERAKADQVENTPGLEYWLSAASGRKPITPLRTRLKRLKLGDDALSFIKSSSDSVFRDKLLTSIEWLTDQDDIQTCRKKLIDRVIEIGDARGLAASHSETLAESLIVEVLKSAIAEDPAARTLTRADLIRLLDSMSTVTMRVPDLSRLIPVALGDLDTNTEIARPNQELVSITQQALPQLFARREELVGKILEAVGDGRTVWLYGMAGSGKTLLARSAADQRQKDWSVARLRAIEAPKAPGTLNMIASAIRAETCEALVIDDLEHLHDERVAVAVASLLSHLRATDTAAVITSYRRPSRTRLDHLGCGEALCLEVPSLSEAEIESLVLESGGGSGWGRYISLATGGGYPILVQALLQNLSAREWPVDAMRSLEGVFTPNTDIEAVREETRHRLIAELSEHTRTLLYRTSILVGAFERDLVDAIAESAPPIERAGEALEQLVGPWVERTADNSYRLTPLVSNAGLHALTKKEAASVHFAAADHLIRQGSINMDQADAILLHGMLGQNRAALLALVSATFRADEATLALIDEYTMLGGLQTDTPLVPEDPIISAQLRVQQVLIAASSKKPQNLPEKWSAMQRELGALEDSEIGATLSILAFTRVLLRPGISSYIPDFMECVAQLPELAVAAGTDLSSETAKEIAPSGELDAVVFAHQICSTDKISTLVEVLDGFCQLPDAHRKRLKSGFEGPLMSPGLAIKSAWAKEQGREGFDHGNAATTYTALAKRLSSADELDFAAAAYETAAAIHDEALKDSDRALALLDEATADVGSLATIERARARILFNRKDYQAFLETIEPLETDRERPDVVEEAFAWREIGVARGHLGDWSKAADAFEHARLLAEGSDTENMVAMQIGLLSDEAIARWNSDDRIRAINLLGQAYERVRSAPDAAGLRSEAVRRLLGHTVMWTSIQLDGSSPLSDDFEYVMIPGANSNPTPHPDIADKPRPDLLILLYLLAKIERHVGGSGQINRQLGTLTEDEASVSMDALDIMDRWKAAKENLNTDEILSLATRVVDVECLMRDPTFDGRGEDLMQLKRGKVPTADEANFKNHVDKVQFDLAGIFFRLAMVGKATEAVELAERLSRLERPILGSKLVDQFRNRDSIDLAANQGPFACSAKLIHCVETDEPLILDDLSIISIRALEVASLREMVGDFGDVFRTWVARTWPATMRSQSFALKRPPEAIAVIDALLDELRPGYRGVGQILEAALPYTSVQVGSNMMEFIGEVARDGVQRATTPL